ncbi:15003_t:CDS:2, partial [Funneliformis geosporum]
LVNHRLKKKYPFKDFATIMKSMVAYAILNIPVDENDEFEIGNNKISYIVLVSKGIINFENTCDDPNESYIHMPYIWSFEEFNMQFWVLRLQLFKELNVSVTLRDLFRDAYHSDQEISLLDLEFQLPTVKSLNITAGQPQTLSKRIVECEYKKVKDAFEVMEKSFENRSPIKHWVLFICTNGSKTRNCLKSLERNCFIIDCENYKHFYRYTFSTRAEFSAEEYELRTISGIGNAIASAIKDKRPFEDENDLYDKVKNIPMEARKKIK